MKFGNFFNIITRRKGKSKQKAIGDYLYLKGIAGKFRFFCDSRVIRLIQSIFYSWGENAHRYVIKFHYKKESFYIFFPSFIKLAAVERGFHLTPHPVD